MEQMKIDKAGWANTPYAFYISAMRTTSSRLAEVDCDNRQWAEAVAAFGSAFQALDEAYQRSQLSLSTKAIGAKDAERDRWGRVMVQVAKQWTKMPDEVAALHGRRVLQVFRDVGFRTTEALVAENEKVANIEQRLAEPLLQEALAAMGLKDANRRFAALTEEIAALMAARNAESSTRVRGELKSARRAMDAAYSRLATLVNALIITAAAPQLETLAQVLNADYRKVEEQMAQSRRRPSVLVRSDIVGNHRYPVPALARWADIVAASSKAFAVDVATGRIVALAPKARKAGGLCLMLNGAAVSPTDRVDEKQKYSLVPIGSAPA